MNPYVLLVDAIKRNVSYLKSKAIDVESESTANQALAMLEGLRHRLEEEKPINKSGVECCYCGQGANGRVLFLSKGEKVVDNPFCPLHERVVSFQTLRGLKVLWPIESTNREFTLTQRWGVGEEPPIMPSDKAKFLIAAGRHVPA